MSSIKHKYNSSVERHMLANQKVWGSILSQGVPLFCCPVLSDMSFYTEITRKNTSSKHRSYTRNVGNRISSITRALVSLNLCSGCWQHRIYTTFYM